MPERGWRGPTIVVLVAAAGAAFGLDRLLGWEGRLEGSGMGGPAVLAAQLLSWKTFLGVALVLAAEVLWPVPTRRPEETRAVALDVGYFAFTFGLWFLLLDLYARGLESLFDGPLAFANVGVGAHWPPIVLGVVAFVLGDFLAWAHHRVRHAVPFLWRFHAVHHSQTQLNLFTDARVHPFEWLFGLTFVALPFFVLGGSSSVGLAVIAGLAGWWTRFAHASVRTSLGPLRYVLVTPQSHRVHHSREAEHHDTNFGVVLSVWDRIFGTQHAGPADEYPETGVPDGVPLETDPVRQPLPVTYLRQLWFPFTAPPRRAPAAAE